jgi:hypothetical protein
MDLQAQKTLIIEQFKKVDDVNPINAIKNMLDYALKKEQENFDIPEAHQKLVNERFAKVRKNPDRLLNWNEAKNTKSLMKYKVKIEPDTLNGAVEITEVTV